MRLLQRFPTVVVLEVERIIDQLRDIIGRVSFAVSWISLAVLAAGALLMASSIQAGMGVRLYEHALLRVLGAPQGLLLGALALEFALLGTLAGLLGAAGAELVAWFFQQRVIEMDYQPHPLLWPAGVLAGLIVVPATGVWAARRILSLPPAQALRHLRR